MAIVKLGPIVDSKTPFTSYSFVLTNIGDESEEINTMGIEKFAISTGGGAVQDDIVFKATLTSESTNWKDVLDVNGNNPIYDANGIIEQDLSLYAKIKIVKEADGGGGPTTIEFSKALTR